MITAIPDISTEKDLLLSKLTVRLRNIDSMEPIGTGVLYKGPELKGMVYVLTAAHTLFLDGDRFLEPLAKVYLDFFNEVANTYCTILHEVNHSLVSTGIDRDVAILIFQGDRIKELIGDIPVITCLNERRSVSTFIIKGFPKATQGKEIVTIHPVWKQAMIGVHKFQLEMKEDYDGWSIGGFSGSGAYLYSSHHLYLYGIFTRYREERKGKIIYCQYMDTVNELLQKNFLPEITFTYFGEHGINKTFFDNQIKTAIANLGPRFNDKLNFRLPVARLFNDLARDVIFRQRLTQAIDRWLTDRHFNYYQSNSRHLEEIQTKNAAIRSNLVDWLSNMNWRPDHPIQWEAAIAPVTELNTDIEKKKHELFDLQFKERDQRSTEEKARHDYRPPYEAEIRRLREIERNNDFLQSDLNNIDVALSNHPCLLIKGEAGCGKSHLLGDIATERTRKGEPTLLLLGQHFKSDQSVWQNVLSQLGLTCTKDQLLETLNGIGKQLGARTLILIDALNEGAGRELWPDEISGFIHEIARFPFIGLCMTVRSTYYTVIVSNNVMKDPLITRRVHEGFKGNEYQALHLFCEHYGLQQPNFPILSPEFTNPLFLHLICDGVRNSEEKVFPQGFQGATRIFNYYIKAVSGKLVKKREEYELKPNIVQRAIEEVAKELMNVNDIRELPLQSTIELFERKFPRNLFLLSDLIHENIFIQTIRMDQESKQEKEVILFSYERFGDFIIAEELLKLFDNAESVKEAFKKDQPLGDLLKEGWWYNKGILEAMAILLPEKFKLEIVEVYEWAFKGKHRNLLGNIDEFINHYLLDSLKWRTPVSIDNDKISNWINGKHFRIDRESFYNAVIGLTILKDHPFNGDRFHLNLMKHTMAERDGFLQNHLRFYAGYADDGSAFPVKRLLDWAWTPGISSRVDFETARLAGQTLAWVLSSTYRKLRDETTKAMVNLLEEQPDVLIAILKTFEDVDDLYVLERLYAVAYGCALRTSEVGYLQKIAQFTFDTIFRDGRPPVHILLRDYSRNVVEYAIYRQASIEGNMDLIRPPYNTSMPDHIPSDEELEEFEIDREAPDFEQRHGRLHNFIKFSIMDWDFGNKTVDSGLREFSAVSFKTETNYKLFLKRLKKKQRDQIKIFEATVKLNVAIEKRGRRYLGSSDSEPYKSIRVRVQNDLEEWPELLKKTLSQEDYLYFSQIIIPYLEKKQKEDDYGRDSFDKASVKRWMVKRAYDLGYDVDLHGYYDYSVDSYNHRSENKIERIGKKYQWIAYHEALAMVADNYKIREDDSSSKKYDYYKGPWQRYLRDINPSFITKTLEEPEDLVETHLSNWWLDQSYNYWDGQDQVLLDVSSDLPDARHIIQRVDEHGKEWLYLHMMITWKEPKPIGKDKYSISRKELWYLFQAYLVKKRDKAKIIRWMKEQDFKGRWMPETHHGNMSIINRENYWAPAAKQYPQKWEYLPDSKLQVMVTTSQAVGELSGDKSGAHESYDMPCQLLFEGLILQYSSVDGNFTDTSGELIAFTTPQGGVLISKNHLQKFLADSELDIMWAQLGEKQALRRDDQALRYNHYKTISGTYYLEYGKVDGEFKFS